MKLPGFNGEASVYTSARHYYAGTATVADNGSVYPAQQTCPPWCVEACEHGCRADGLSQNFCAKLCQSDCGAYGTAKPVSCGACVDNMQACTLCGGAQVTRGCGSLPCGDGFCPLSDQCCDGNTCCPADAICCHDGHGCCPAGQQCGSFLGVYYCVPNWLSGIF